MSSSAAHSAIHPPSAPSANDRLPVPKELSAGSDLESAFELFNEVSTQLSASYQQMSERVSELNVELHQLAEQRLHELNEKKRVSSRLESLLKLLPAGVVVIDNQGVIMECNPAAEDILGEPLVGQLWRQVIQRSFAPRSDDGHEISLRDGRRISIATRSFEEEAGQILLLTDLTETRELQQRLSRHRRLSEMGRMMSSLAHQIRTPISAAMLYAGHLCESELDADQTRRFSEKIRARLIHMEQQIKAMLIFVKGDVKLTEVVTTEGLMVELESAMEVAIEASSSAYRIDNQCPSLGLLCNSESMVGALMNLVNNAIQAAGSGVSLDIKVRPLGDDQLQLVICDDGPGIADHIVKNIGEPFFTTKPQGTGLGLAVVRAVVQAHRGQFTLNSISGEGACAIIELPLHSNVDGEVAHEQ